MARRLPVTTLLGFAAVAVILSAVTAVLVRQPDTHRAAAVRPPVVIPSSAALTTSTTSTAQAPAAKHQAPSRVLGKTVHRAARGQAQALPFTGPAPMVPASAIGLLAVIGGAWLLVRWPAAAQVSGGYDATFAGGVSVTVRNPFRDGAIERLRSPGHQLARPSTAAIDGTSSDLTTNVSSSSPAVTANPVS